MYFDKLLRTHLVKTWNVYNKLLAAKFNLVKTSKKRTSGTLGEILARKMSKNRIFRKGFLDKYLERTLIPLKNIIPEFDVKSQLKFVFVKCC